MKSISLTGVGIAGAIASINAHFNEQIENVKKRHGRAAPELGPNAFEFPISRDFEGPDETFVIIEIVNVEPEDKSVGYRGLIEIEAYTEDGKSMKLTDLEYERAIERAVEHLAKANKEVWNDRRD